MCQAFDPPRAMRASVHFAYRVSSTFETGTL
jgi:hypothetical protein